MRNKDLMKKGLGHSKFFKKSVIWHVNEKKRPDEEGIATSIPDSID